MNLRASVPPWFKIQIIMSTFRIEKDTMGTVEVPANVYWGAQTQRSIENFKIAQDINQMPKEIIRAFVYLKKPQPSPTWKQEF